MIALLLACHTDTAAPTTQSELLLTAGWSAHPWAESVRSNPITIEGTFDLGDDPGAGSVLVVEGAWWNLSATVNGTVLPGVTGGLTEAHIPVGPHLRDGDNTLHLTVSPPGNTDPILTGGSLSSTARQAQNPLLWSPPRLLLRPGVYLDDAWLEVRDGTLHPHATAVGAPSGATIRFSATLDGSVLASLGEVAVVSGQADASADVTDLPRWQSDAAQLIHLTAELRDASGTSLDTLAVRTGIRELSAVPFTLNGSPLRLMGARVVNDGPQTSLPQTMATFAPAGINAAEIHGETFRRDWLDAADELGLPVVVVPRCIGRCSRYTGDKEAILHQMGTQDTATARLLRRHPSVVLLAAEGPVSGGLPLWTQALLGSGIPLAGHDIPARILSLKATDTLQEATLRCQPKDCRRAWLVELTPWWRKGAEEDKPGSALRWRLLADALIEYMQPAGGAIGAIVPSANPREIEGWEASWQRAAAALSIEPVSGSGRGPATVVVRGAAPGETVWLRAPMAPTVGAIADQSGVAELSLWHTGPATVIAGATQQAITLRPGQWQKYRWQPSVVEVELQR